MNITDSFLECLSQIAEIKLTSQILHQIKRCLLDYIGIVYAGRKQLGDKLNEIERIGNNDNCSIIGCNKKKELYTAAMMNGFAAHVLELDDGHRVGAPHIGAVILSTMIGIAQKEHLSFESFVKGILIGYEATIRVSTAIQPSHKLKGFHATGTCGVIGAACAVGYALGLNDIQIKGAVSAAASAAAGLLQVLDDDSELKPFNVSNAILSGITAAYMGKCGFKGPEDVFGGKRGFFHAFCDEVKDERLIDQNDTLAIFQHYVKPFASCRHSHPAVECVLGLCNRNRIIPAEIKEIEVQTYKLAIYSHDLTNITSVSAAKMSTPFSIAVSILLGTCGIDAFSEDTINRRDIKELTKKVHIIENSKLTAACPEKRGAIVLIRMRNGEEFVDKVENPLGEPENPLTDTQLEEKYLSLMDYSGISRKDSEKIKKMIWNLERNYKEFMEKI